MINLRLGMNHCKSVRYIIGIVMLAAGIFSLSAQSDKKTARIVILHSYHPSFDWTRTMHDAMVSVLDEWGGDFSLSVEYMDTKRIYTPEHLEGLKTLYTAKYHNSPPDLIISSDNNAFSFLYHNRNEVFGESIPVVFCGVNYFEKDEWPELNLAIGVDERPSLEDTIQLIDSLHPGKPTIAFINDRSVSGDAYKGGYLSWRENRSDADRFVFVDKGYPEDIVAEIGRMPEDTIVIYHTYARDPAGNHYQPEKLLQDLESAYDFPIYGNYVWMVGSGIIGGPLIDAGLQGSTSAKLAIGILEGFIDPAAFRIEASPSRLFFDYGRLKKAEIKLSQLPAGSEIVGKPDVIWREYPKETLFGSTVFLLLLTGFIVLSRLLRRRNELIDETRQAISIHLLDEQRLETVGSLAHLNDVDDRDIIEKILRDLTEITDSHHACGVVEASSGERRGWFLDVEGTTNLFSELPRNTVLQQADKYKGANGVVLIDDSGGPLFTGTGSIGIRRGVVYAYESDDNLALLVGIFNRPDPYSDGDIRQLRLLADGTWRILTRQHSVRELNRLNRELEERVESRSLELREAEKEILRADRLAMLGSLVAGIAHEVNTPLGIAITSISHLSSLVGDIENADSDRKRDLLKTTKELIDISDTQLNRAAQIMKSFKQVAVDQTGEDFRVFDLSEVMSDVVTSLRAEVRRSSVEIHLDCPVGIILQHFPGDLWRVFTNLVINSLKHGYPNGGPGRIGISIRSEDSTVMIVYTDDGIGIPSEHLSKVFEPFFTTARDRGGTGLGLHIVKSIVEDRHGGRISAASTEGEGAEFTITMPSVSPAMDLST